MPYIKKIDRLALLRQDKQEETSGELNYSITRLCHRYLLNHGKKYQTFNDILGALTGAQLEIYRRKVSIYENEKIKENGDLL